MLVLQAKRFNTSAIHVCTRLWGHYTLNKISHITPQAMRVGYKVQYGMPQHHKCLTCVDEYLQVNVRVVHLQQKRQSLDTAMRSSKVYCRATLGGYSIHMWDNVRTHQDGDHSCLAKE